MRTGDYDLSVQNEALNFHHQSLNIARVIIHPQYNKSELLNDIALIQLQTPSLFSESTNSVCLPRKFQRFIGQRYFTIFDELRKVIAAVIVKIDKLLFYLELATKSNFYLV